MTYGAQKAGKSTSVVNPDIVFNMRPVVERYGSASSLCSATYRKNAAQTTKLMAIEGNVVTPRQPYTDLLHAWTIDFISSHCRRHLAIPTTSAPPEGVFVAGKHL